MSRKTFSPADLTVVDINFCCFQSCRRALLMETIPDGPEMTRISSLQAFLASSFSDNSGRKATIDMAISS
ncbi:hypothetical protein SMX63_003732 [Cronobacter universalis]|nr:hypothetical protein [Cronobacter universalis]